MFERVLSDLGITQENVRRAIRNLVAGSPELQREVSELAGSGFTKCGSVNGQDIFTKA